MNDAFYEVKNFGEVIESDEIQEHWAKIKHEFDTFFQKLRTKLDKKP